MKQSLFQDGGSNERSKKRRKGKERIGGREVGKEGGREGIEKKGIRGKKEEGEGKTFGRMWIPV